MSGRPPRLSLKELNLGGLQPPSCVPESCPLTPTRSVLNPQGSGSCLIICFCCFLCVYGVELFLSTTSSPLQSRSKATRSRTRSRSRATRSCTVRDKKRSQTVQGHEVQDCPDSTHPQVFQSTFTIKRETRRGVSDWIWIRVLTQIH